MTHRTHLQKFIEAFFGTEPESAPGQPDAGPLPANVTAQRGRRAMTRNEVVMDALKRALHDFISTEARAYVSYYPRLRFALEQIVLLQTPDNMAYLQDLAHMKRKIRNGIAQACIADLDSGADVLDTNRFCDWSIEPSPDAGGDDRSVYSVVAGVGADVANFEFVFYGDYVELEPELRDRGANAADDVPTLEPGTPGGHAVCLRVAEPGKEVRILQVADFPVVIGRGSQCAVAISSPYVSRVHACIRLAAGRLVVENNSERGTRLRNTTQDIEIRKGDHLVLPGEGTLILGRGGVEIGFTSSGHAEDEVQTLELQQAGAESAATHASAAPTDVGAVSPAPATLRSTQAPLACLIIRHGDGRTERRAITRLPLTIGREPDGADGVTLTDVTCRSSRIHLRIERQQGGSFITENLAHGAGKGGTWLHGDALGARFAWRADAPGAEPHWHGLGQRAEAAGAVMVRLEKAT